MSGGERREREDRFFGVGHQWTHLGEADGELVGDLVPAGGDGLGVGLSEDGSEQRGGHVLVAAGHTGQQVADEMHPTSLSGRALQ